MQKRNLFEMSRPEVERAIAAGVDTVVVPFGSTEQHGLPLPLGTDAILGEALGSRVVQALGNALLAPGIPIGCSEHHMDFAGSLTLSQETFYRVVADLAAGAARTGRRSRQPRSGPRRRRKSRRGHPAGAARGESNCLYRSDGFYG